VGIFAHLDFLTQYISPSRRRSMAATAKFNGMIEDLITRKRDEIRSNKAEDIPDNEKDLLRLMIEADDRGEGFTSVEELRVCNIINLYNL
jgi:cytochrome P450